MKLITPQIVWSYALACVPLLVLGCGPPSREASSPTEATKMPESQTMPRVALEAVKNATVLIGNFENGQLTASGSGFVVEDGKTIITNKHVVTGTDDVVDDCKIVFFSGTDHVKLVTVSASDITVFRNVSRNSSEYNDADVAAIKLTERAADPLVLADIKSASETMKMWGFGFPGGTEIRTGSDDMPTVTVHSLTVERIVTTKGEVSAIQLAGSPTHGDSGGPVVDAEGKVFGVMQALALPDSVIVYAIATPMIKKIIDAAKPGHSTYAEFEAPIGKASQLPQNSGQSQATETRSTVRELFPETRDHVLTDSEMAAMSDKEIQIALTEIVIRHGYDPTRPLVRGFFQRVLGDNFRPVPGRRMDQAEQYLTSIERANYEGMAHERERRKALGAWNAPW